jgi:hypothetical protein
MCIQPMIADFRTFAFHHALGTLEAPTTVWIARTHALVTRVVMLTVVKVYFENILV